MGGYSSTGCLLLFALLLVVGASTTEYVYTRDDMALHSYPKRDISYRTFEHLRNGHACIMSISFIVLLPLGAIALHLPIESTPYLRNSYLIKKVIAMHVPIQSIALALIIAAMGMGIRIAQYLDYFNHPAPWARAHTVVGLIVVCTLILFQPALGVAQHLYYRKTGGRSVFAPIHRWLGRGIIVAGMINSGLGLKLASRDRNIKASSYIRNYALMGVLVAVWIGLVLSDWVVTRRKATVRPDDKLNEATVEPKAVEEPQKS